AYRRRFDGARGGSVSRFVNEIPPELLDRDDAVAATRRWEDAARGAHAARGPRRRDDDYAWVVTGGAAPAWAKRALGRQVYHESFGRGVVVAAEGAGEDVKYTVRFREGTKKVLGRFLSAGADGDEA